MAEMPGETQAVNVLAAFVERDKHGFVRDCGRDRGTFLGDARGGIAGAAFGNFMNVDAAKSEPAAGIIEPLAIALRELTLGSLLQATDRNDDDTHAHAGSMRSSEMTSSAVSDRVQP